MTRLVLLDGLPDDVAADPLAPVTTARPLAEVRAGARLIRERWASVFGLEPVGVIAALRLAGFEEPGSLPVLSDDSVIEAGTIVVRSDFAPSLGAAATAGASTWLHDGVVVAQRVGATSAAALRSEGLSRGNNAAALPGWALSRAWDLIGHLPAMLAEDALHLAAGAGDRAPLPADVRVIGEHPVCIDPSAVIEPFVVFDATQGAIIIEAHAAVRSFSRLTGPFVLGRHSQWMTGSGHTVSVGDHCKVTGEVSTTILCGHANKGHDGFVGHSYLGRWTNLGAGTVTSNLKNTYGPVSFAGADTGLQFLGSIVGDHAKTGILTRLTTGSCIGAGSNVISDDVVTSVVPPFTFGTRNEPYDRRRFLETAERVMARRKVVLSDAMRACLARVYDVAMTGNTRSDC